MSHVCRVVDAFGQPLNGVEIFWERRPTPFDSSFHGFGRNILGPFQVAHDHEFVLFTARGQRETTVSHHHAGDTMPTRTSAEGVPKDLSVHMGMAINKTGGHYMAVGIDDFVGAVANLSYTPNLSSDDANIGLEAWHARTVNNGSISNQ